MSSDERGNRLETTIDEDKVNKLFVKIYFAERRNLRTENLSDKDMREEIIKIIEGGR